MSSGGFLSASLQFEFQEQFKNIRKLPGLRSEIHDRAFLLLWSHVRVLCADRGFGRHNFHRLPFVGIEYFNLVCSDPRCTNWSDASGHEDFQAVIHQYVCAFREKIPIIISLLKSPDIDLRIQRNVILEELEQFLGHQGGYHDTPCPQTV